ncbi:MAG: SAM-dependent methyltransferase [Nitrospirae bacterium]|nr:SAM-dependent methyltransferase [Nitrospirota bacterium]
MPNTLEEIIRAEISAQGAITFERFVELALYHPEHGYYASGRAAIGKAGDFYTSPHASRVFGELVAESYLSFKAGLGGGPCAFVEMGAGTGIMARDFLEHLDRYHPEELPQCEYIIVERSAGMMARQKETLGAMSGRVAWRYSLDALSGPVTGVFFSNELVDSFPFHRVYKENGYLREVYVETRGGRLVEEPGVISTPLLARYFNRLVVSLETGMTTEANLRACEWMRSVAEKLEKGFVVTVDYGYPAYEYYSPERDKGTAICHRDHKASLDFFRDIGQQDITAHVDFTNLALEGREAGLTDALYADQSSFLASALEIFERTLRKAGAPQEELERVGMGIKALIHPDWMGGAFKALVQTKGVSLPDVFGSARNRLDELWQPGRSGSLNIN